MALSQKNFFFFLIVCGIVLSGMSMAQKPDSTGMIFDDTKICHYELTFFTPYWEDSLLYYKNLPEEEYFPARFTWRSAAGDSIAFDSIGVRYKGNSSFIFAKNSPKKPFKFRFDKFKSGQTFFGHERLNFSNGAKDPTNVREKVAYDVIRRYMPAPRASFATISVSGEIIGLYTQVEQIDNGFIKRNFAKDKGNLYKSADNGATLVYKGQNQSSYEPDYDLKTNETVNDWSGLIDMIDRLNNSPDSLFIATAGARLDLGRGARYVAFNMVLSNFDSYTGSGRNFYLYDDPSSQKFSVIPWDLNLSFGVYTNNWNVITVDVIKISNLNQRPLAGRILGNDSLRTLYLQYIREMIDGPFNPDTISAAANRLKPVIDSCVKADTNKLHTYTDFNANFENDVTIMEGPVKTVIPGIRSFAIKRGANLRIQLGLPIVTPKVSNTVSRRTVWATALSGVGISVHYALPCKEMSPVRITLMNSRGRLIQSVADGIKSAGSYSCTLNVTPISSGYYFVVVHAGRWSAMTPVLLLR
jgi:hypothetical protein